MTGLTKQKTEEKKIMIRKMKNKQNRWSSMEDNKISDRTLQ